MATDLNPYHPPSIAPDGVLRRSRRWLYVGCLLTALVCNCVFWFWMIKIVPVEVGRGAEIQNDVRLILNVSEHVYGYRYFWMFVAVVFVAGLGRIEWKHKRGHNARTHFFLRALFGLVVWMGIIVTVRMVVYGWPAIQRLL